MVNLLSYLFCTTFAISLCKATKSVTSTFIVNVNCALFCKLAYIRFAIALRIPVTGITLLSSCSDISGTIPLTSSAFNTSAFVILPPGPVPTNTLISKFSDFAIFFATGEILILCLATSFPFGS